MRCAGAGVDAPGGYPLRVPTATTDTSPGLLARLRDTYEVLAREVAKFGTIGLIAYIIDTTLYNLLVFGPKLDLGGKAEGPLATHWLRATVIATGVAMVFSWLGNRYWTYRHQRRANLGREFVFFVIANIIGLLIGIACLWVSRSLGFHTQFTDNFSRNIVGLALGTLFRFWAYRTFVFKGDALADVHVPGLDEHHIEETPHGIEHSDHPRHEH